MAVRAHTIVVGVDESPSAQRAIRWALCQARASGAVVRLVQAWQVPSSWTDEPRIAYPAAGPLIGRAFVSEQEETEWARSQQQKLGGLRAAAEHRIEQALGHAVGGVPADPAPQIEAVEGDTGEVLVAASATAQLLVVGSHRTSGVAAAVLGSVSHHCALHAHCPVVIIPAGVEISPDGQLGSAGAPEVASEGRGVK